MTPADGAAGAALGRRCAWDAAFAAETSALAGLTHHLARLTMVAA